MHISIFCCTFAASKVNDHKKLISMEKQQLQASMPIQDGRLIQALMELYRFEEGDTHIVYCPSLDLSAAGTTAPEALREFMQIFKMHIEDCIEQGTLHDDLIAHGWKHTRTAFKAPKTTKVLERNAMLRDIVNNRSYRREIRPITLPRRVSRSIAFA